MIDSYTAIDILPPKEYAARKKKLLARHNKFVRHLKAYPESAGQLERLTVEVRDDDGNAGWQLLEEFASQVQNLKIHIFDRFFTPESEVRKKREMMEKDRRTADEYNKLSWARLVDSQSMPPHRLPLLTSLTIHSTARTIYHLNHIAEYLPSLSTLTLGQHWTDDYGCLSSESCDAVFQKLEYLSVIGSIRWIRTILCGIPLETTGGHAAEPLKPALLNRCPKLRSLTLNWLDPHRDPHDERFAGRRDLESIIRHIAARRLPRKKQVDGKAETVGEARDIRTEEEEDPEGQGEDGDQSEDGETDQGVPIRRLAIFGEEAETVMYYLREAQSSYLHPWAFQGLTDLVLEPLEPAYATRDAIHAMYTMNEDESDAEESDGSGDEGDYWSEGEDDDDDDEDEDEDEVNMFRARQGTGLPALQRVTWIYPQGKSRLSGGPEDQGGITMGGFDKAGLQELLDRYPSLQQASCLSEYPRDPFGPIEPSDPNVICTVQRRSSSSL